MRTAILLCLLTAFGMASTQAPPQVSRLVAVVPTSWACIPNPPFGPTCTPSSVSLFELDWGGNRALEIPTSSTIPAYTQGPGLVRDSAVDPVSGHLFFYDEFSGNILYTIDLANGSLIGSVSLASPIRHLEFEPSMAKLLAFVSVGGIPFLMQVDPASGALTNAGLTSGYPTLAPLADINSGSALDSIGNRMFIRSNSGGLSIVNTATGALMATFIAPVGRFLEYDSTSSRLLCWGVVASGGLAEVNTTTGNSVLVGPASSFVPPTGLEPYALDEKRGIFHLSGRSFDSISGERVAGGGLTISPFAPQWPFLPFLFAVDPNHAPAQGLVTFQPRNDMFLGDSVTVSLEAQNHSSEVYVPFFSCTPGAFPVPGSNITLPIAFDWCTSLYFGLDSSLFFALALPGQTIGTLSPTGTAQGTVSLPNVPASFFNLDVYITFLTISSGFQWTGFHGSGVLHVHL